MRDAQFMNKTLIISILASLLMIPYIGYLDFRANAISQGRNNYVITEAFIFCEIIIANNIVKRWGGATDKMSLLLSVGLQ